MGAYRGAAIMVPTAAQAPMEIILLEPRRAAATSARYRQSFHYTCSTAATGWVAAAIGTSSYNDVATSAQAYCSLQLHCDHSSLYHTS